MCEFFCGERWNAKSLGYSYSKKEHKFNLCTYITHIDIKAPLFWECENGVENKHTT